MAGIDSLLVSRENRHAIPKAPAGFYWECVSYSGDEYQFGYFKLRCERCGAEFDEPYARCKWPPEEDLGWEIPAPDHTRADCDAEIERQRSLIPDRNGNGWLLREYEAECPYCESLHPRYGDKIFVGDSVHGISACKGTKWFPVRERRIPVCRVPGYIEYRTEYYIQPFERL